MIKVKTQKFEKIWGYEIWVYSPVKGKQSSLSNGKFATEGPLVKIIHADRPLSVQVHPDDEFARELENEKNGKSESWFVLEAKPDSNIVTGLKTYDDSVIRKAMKDNKFEDLLIKTPTKAGDFFNIESGLVHGIGSGVTVLEVQQPSETTYRYYDYNRLENGSPRELHLDKALKVQKDLDFKLKPTTGMHLTYRNSVGTQVFTQNKEYEVQSNFLVVNLDSYETYITEKKEIIEKGNYAVISLNN